MYISPSIIDRCIYYVNLLLKTINLYFRLIIKFLENLKFSIWPSAPQFVEQWPAFSNCSTFWGAVSHFRDAVPQKVNLFYFVLVSLNTAQFFLPLATWALRRAWTHLKFKIMCTCTKSAKQGLTIDVAYIGYISLNRSLSLSPSARNAAVSPASLTCTQPPLAAMVLVADFVRSKFNLFCKSVMCAARRHA